MTGRVFWKTFSERNRSAERSLDFPLTPDGEVHTYEIDLSLSPKYAGKIVGVEVAPVTEAQPGETIRVKSISHRKKD